MAKLLNPCELCPVFPICTEVCNAKINYGISLRVEHDKLVKEGSKDITKIEENEKLGKKHTEEMVLIEKRWRRETDKWYDNKK